MKGSIPKGLLYFNLAEHPFISCGGGWPTGHPFLSCGGRGPPYISSFLVRPIRFRVEGLGFASA